MAEPTPIRLCHNCNSSEHLTTACPNHQPTQGGLGGCIRCGSMSIYPWIVDEYDHDWQLVRCLNCGLIASETM